MEDDIVFESLSFAGRPISSIGVVGYSYTEWGFQHPYVLSDAHQNDDRAYVWLWHRFPNEGPEHYQQDGDHQYWDDAPCHQGGPVSLYNQTSDAILYDK